MTATVVVGICTFKRNEQLDRLLSALARISHTPPPGYRIDVVVVDDDPGFGAESVVQAARASFGGELVYRRAGSANLSTARNTVIEEGVQRGDWLAFIDDDCLPDTQWVDQLLALQRRTGADIVTGRQVYTTRQGGPRWLLDEPFWATPDYPDGEEPEYGNTPNVLLSTRFLDDSGVRFRQSLGLTGGEDMTFYSDARAAGAVMRFASHAVVYEELTASRESLAYNLHRQFWLGNNMVVINRHTHRESMARLLVRGVKRTGTSLVAPVLRRRRGEPPQVRWALAYALQGVGLVLGVFGVTVRHKT